MPWTNVQLLANVRDRTSGQYNNALYNAVNQNLVQGQIHSVSVNEVNFPYDIPNIQTLTSSFSLYNGPLGPPGQGNPGLDVTVPVGFYTGTELATAVTNAMIAAGATAIPPFLAADMPTCIYDNTSNRFSFVPSVNAEQWILSSSFTFPFVYVYEGQAQLAKLSPLGKDIFSLMGFVKDNNLQPTLTGPAPAPPSIVGNIVSGSAPLTFTQYIDICSPELCQYQYFRDGSTTNLARRSDVICRLYISNNVATQEEEGTRPFVINRQFNNARVMRWNAGSSVGSMSIQLYDDVGQPLQITWQPRPYQITFNVYEQDKDGITY